MGWQIGITEPGSGAGPHILKCDHASQGWEGSPGCLSPGSHNTAWHLNGAICLGLLHVQDNQKQGGTGKCIAGGWAATLLSKVN